MWLPRVPLQALGREHALLLEQLGCATKERDAQRESDKVRRLDAQASLQVRRDLRPVPVLSALSARPEASGLSCRPQRVNVRLSEEHAERMAEAHAQHDRRVAVREQGLAILRHEMAELEMVLDASRAEVYAQARQLEAVASRMSHLVRLHEAQADEIVELRSAAQQASGLLCNNVESPPAPGARHKSRSEPCFAESAVRTCGRPMLVHPFRVCAAGERVGRGGAPTSRRGGAHRIATPRRC
jgi:hypothetical protein